MRLFRCFAAAILLTPLAMADLTVDQKTSDFLSLVAQYSKNYGPYELKRDLFGFDLLNAQPWIDQIKASKTDIDFYDICTRYVASLQDSHDEFTIPSSFDAWLHFDGDIYDGKFLIDYLDRSYLSRALFPFTIGDELISVDGVAVADLITQFQPYAVNGSSNPTSRNRLAAAMITERYQGWNPRAASIGKAAVIVVQRAATGTMDSYTINWDVQGVAVTTAGLTPSPVYRLGKNTTQAEAHHYTRPESSSLLRRKGTDAENEQLANPWGTRVDDGTPAITDAPLPSYMQPLHDLQTMGGVQPGAGFTEFSGISPFGSTFPVFKTPPGFNTRLGLRTSDFFYSGTYTSNGSKIGLIRIPTMSPSSTAAATAQFASEVQYMQQNTDGLVVDVMANGGGSVCYAQNLVGYFMNTKFRGVSSELRASLQWQRSFANSVTIAKSSGAPQYVVDLYNAYLTDIETALSQNRGRTGSEPLCSYTFDADPPFDKNGNLLSYTKPVIVLTDNFTLSSAEIFTMMMQDNSRALIVGTRTDGGGGNVVSFPNVGAYSEGSTRITESIITRSKPFAAPGFPSIPYYDGVGLYPDVFSDYMTARNLATSGTDFIGTFTQTIVDSIARSKQ